VALPSGSVLAVTWPSVLYAVTDVPLTGLEAPGGV
jgi:hypothetical protein